MFKKFIIVIFSFLIVSVLALGGRFYWQNLRGIKTVLLAPSYDIEKKIDNIEKDAEVKPEIPEPETPVSGQSASTSKIRVSSPEMGALIQSPLEIDGEAVGGWFFEASFPAVLFDSDSKELARSPVQAIGDWMTDRLVPFNGRLEFEPSSTATGTLVLEKDNPSGLAENAEQIEVPVRFK
jgi:hypothetical protein